MNYIKLVFSLLIVFLTACSTNSIEGSWVESAPGMPGVKQGFTLYADGKASSINMATLQYELWEQKGDQLILSGKSIGNRQTVEFSDTFQIQNLTKEGLTLLRGTWTSSYVRVNEEQVDRIADVVASQKEELETVRGILEITHEVRSFKAEGDTSSYWIVDTSGELLERYDKVTGGVKNGTPVYVELNVLDKGRSEEGFAASYAGVYHVVSIRDMRIK